MNDDRNRQQLVDDAGWRLRDHLAWEIFSRIVPRSTVPPGATVHYAYTAADAFLKHGPLSTASQRIALFHDGELWCVEYPDGCAYPLDPGLAEDCSDEQLRATASRVLAKQGYNVDGLVIRRQQEEE